MINRALNSLLDAQYKEIKEHKNRGKIRVSNITLSLFFSSQLLEWKLTTALNSLFIFYFFYRKTIENFHSIGWKTQRQYISLNLRVNDRGFHPNSTVRKIFGISRHLMSCFVTFPTSKKSPIVPKSRPPNFCPNDYLLDRQEACACWNSSKYWEASLTMAVAILHWPSCLILFLLFHKPHTIVAKSFRFTFFSLYLTS